MEKPVSNWLSTNAAAAVIGGLNILMHQTIPNCALCAVQVTTMIAALSTSENNRRITG